ncbi:SulP family inorganic anion transporter [Synechococcus sp. ATX 2A4]|uniref:SulP family inorganic anion transporter n=1 Tax=Synechococcus sp. ATX 2A4 TaxID=2823727 RepID=UPI0020CFDBB5|nr:SulP family inorganic anion transporter [Synechococcus sp. ATX 2A4]MCP9884110.1 SulP family inorganic anion transporter [Synechococcus sp. ATX 2A4]
MPQSWSLIPDRRAISQELLAGIVVALGIIPEAIAFSIVAGVDPKVGLFGSIVILIIVALLGGRPGMVSACTAGVALLMGGLVQSHGLSYLLAASILAGALQILWGYLRLAQQMRFVPRAVTLGFVNAIGVLIFLAQWPQLGIGRDGDEVIPSLAASGQSIQWPWVWGLVVLGLLIIYLLPRLTRLVPSTLVAILVISGLAEWWQLPIPRVGDLGQLPSSWPTFQIPPVFGAWDTWGIILPTALAISFVGLLQSFLTANVVEDSLDEDADYEAEARAQGVANIIAGLFGGMAGAGMIGQSVINLESGGRYRLSTLTAGVGLLILVISLSTWLARIPMAALVAVMIMVAVSTVNWESFLKADVIPKSDTAVMLLTLVLAVVTRNLAIAVLVGVALAGILFSRKVAKVISVTSTLLDDDHLYYSVCGQLFFVSTVYFLASFKPHRHHARITIDMQAAHVWDQTGMRVLDQVIRKLQQAGSMVELINLNKESLDLFGRISDTPDFVIGASCKLPDPIHSAVP